MVHGYDPTGWEQNEPPAWQHVRSDYNASRTEPVVDDYSDIYSVPRRFDLASMLVVTTAYALLFTGMTLLDFPFESFVYFAFLIALVAAAQSVVDKKYNPRVVSVIVGVAYYFSWMFVLFVTTSMYRAGDSAGCLACSTAVLGPLQGYLAGTLVAGTFLVADYLRTFLGWIHLHREREASEAEVQSPWDE